MKKIILFIATTLFLLMAISCSQNRHTFMYVPPHYGAMQYRHLTPEQKIKFLMNEFGFCYSMALTISAGQYEKGMSKTQVLYSLGRPDKVSKASGSWGIEQCEQWIYRYRDKDLHIIFRVNKLIKWFVTYHDSHF